MARLPPATQAALVILLATLLRLIFAAGMGLGIDESYMVTAAHSYHWSYFDHPPVSWFMELTAQRLTGMHSALIVRLPFIAAFAATSGLMFGLTNRLFGPNAALWSVIALTISPVFSVAFGTWVLPDGPLDLSLLAAAWALARALGIAAPTNHEPEPASEPAVWPAAGLFAGLAMLSKYTAILTLLGALLFLLTDRAGRRSLATTAPWIAGLIALAAFSPVLIWNAEHHFASFDYQGARATGLALHPLRPFIVWAGEALFIAPWIFIPMIALLLHGLTGRDRRAKFLACLALIPIVLFSLVGLWSGRKILYHWAAPGYLMLFPLLGDWISRLTDRHRKPIAAIAAATAALLTIGVLFIVAQLNFNIIPDLNAHFPPGKSPELQAIDWTSLRTQLAARHQLDTPNLAIAALRWYDAGKIAKALPGMKVTVFEGNQHEFGITTPPASLIGHNILIAAMPGNPATIAHHYAPRFKTLTPEPPIIITHNGQPLLTIPLLLGHDLLSWPETKKAK